MTVALHKPYGVLSQFTAEVPGQRTLAEFELPPKLYPIGRLDRDSEGLLLLTDDNRLKTTLLDPDSHTSKRYCAQVEGIPDGEALDMLSRGVEIRIKKRAYLTRPAKVQAIADPGFAERLPPVRFRKHIPTSWIQLQLTEGKNRQVRRMCAAVGYPVLRLVRTEVGDYSMGNLMPGKWREIG